MDPFAKRKVTEAERIEILAKAREEYAAAGAMQFLVASSTEEYLAGVEASIEVERPVFEAPAPLTALEKADFERRLNESIVMDRVFGDRMADRSTGCKVLDDAWQAHEDAEMRKFLKPAQDAQIALDKMVTSAVERAFQKVSGNLESTSRIPLPVKPLPSREGIMPLVRAAVEENPLSDAARFLSAFASGDEAGMRRLVREIVRAEAAA